MRIALAQMNACVGDFEGNSTKIINFIERAKNRDADLVVFPELALTGYPPEDLVYRRHFVDDNQKWLNKIAAHVKDIVVVLGCLGHDKERLYDSAAIMFNKVIHGYYHKICLPNYSVFDEKRYFAAGEKPLALSVNGFLLALTICEDIWSSGSSLDPIKSNVSWDGVLNLSSSPYTFRKYGERKQIVSKIARKHKAHVFYANMIGGQDELVFDGRSLVVSPKGRILAEGASFNEDLVLYDHESPQRKPNIRRGTKSLPVLHFQTGQTKTKRPIRKYIHQTHSSESEIYQALVRGTQDYVIKNNFQRVVIGLSGGIDSALTAVIACDALGPENVICVTMPSKYSSGETQNDSLKIAKKLGASLLVLPIQKIFKTYLSELEQVFFGRESNIAEENIQSRIRGNLLMALSNKFGWLVLSTGNKSETSCGYATLYGDMAGGLAVLKDIYKTTVYDLARYRNAQQRQDYIPDSVIKRAPSAELRADQKDQDSLPPYSKLDAILKLYIEEKKSVARIVKAGFSKSMVEDVVRLVESSEHKRRQSPPGIKITPLAFGKDRRFPITNRYRG